LPGTAAWEDYSGGAGQGVSAAKFFPRGHQFEKEAKAHGVSTRGCQICEEAVAHDVRGSGVESDEDSAPLKWVVEADHKAMRILANNRSFLGTSASRMAADTRAAEAAPGRTGVGTDYAAWLRDLPHESGLSHHRQSTGTGVPGGHEPWQAHVGHPPPLPVEGTRGWTQSPRRTHCGI
jgi:hypothetical protein